MLAAVFAAAIGEGAVQFADGIVGGANGAGFVSSEIVRGVLEVFAGVAEGFDGSRNARMPLSLGLSNQSQCAATEERAKYESGEKFHSGVFPFRDSLSEQAMRAGALRRRLY